jgi:hypothetical protein
MQRIHLPPAAILERWNMAVLESVVALMALMILLLLVALVALIALGGPTHFSRRPFQSWQFRIQLTMMFQYWLKSWRTCDLLFDQSIEVRTLYKFNVYVVVSFGANRHRVGDS